MKALASRTQNGERFLVFPEGKYQKRQGNSTFEFKRGCFVSAMRAKCPIVPVALIDSYKVFNSFHLGPITTYVHYLEPIYYDEYKDMKSQELAEYVKKKIQDKITECTL